MKDPSPPAPELNGWLQIAAYLGISIREAQNREKSDGMPIHRLIGKKARVWAYGSELDAWKSTRLGVSKGSAESSHSLAVARKVEFDGLKCNTEGQPAPMDSPGSASAQHGVEKPSGSEDTQTPDALRPTMLLTRRNLIAGTVFGIGGALVAGASIKPWRHREMAMLSVDGPVLIARDVSGKEMWRHLFTGGLYSGQYQPATFNSAHWIGDLDGDGHAEALFTYTTVDSAGRISSLFCFSRTGDVKWVFHPGRVVRDSGGDILPPYWVPAFLVCFTAGSERQARVVVAGCHTTDQACQLGFLDASGRLVAEYWHPGQLYLLAETRAGFGAAPLLLAGGVNNGEHRATLVVLDPFAMKGATTPSRMKDQRFRLLDMPDAHEELVVLFPRSCLSRDEPYTRLQRIEADEQAVRVVTIESHDVTPRAIFYEFDRSLALRRAFLSSEYRQEHLRLEQSGKLSHFADADEAALARGVERSGAGML